MPNLYGRRKAFDDSPRRRALRQLEREMAQKDGGDYEDDDDADLVESDVPGMEKEPVKALRSYEAEREAKRLGIDDADSRGEYGYAKKRRRR